MRTRVTHTVGCANVKQVFASTADERHGATAPLASQTSSQRMTPVLVRGVAPVSVGVDCGP